MYKKVIDIFKKITTIPHCSNNTEKLQAFIEDYAKERDFIVFKDKSGNILCYKNTPKLALQSHIDMVCVGDAPKIEIIEENGWLKAKNSTLGADNGIGIAIMLAFMDKYPDIEYLFTNDEEIGLIGAKNLEFSLKAPYLLNLDSENDNEIIIGCAGGVDAKIKYPVKKEKVFGSLGDVSITNLPGGHSGVDIDKNIPNAIVELLFKVDNIAYIKGGERRNSIPSNAYAKEVFDGEKEIEIYKSDYLEFLRKLPHGVLEYDFEFKIPSKSVNFALIDGNEIVLSARANSNEKLNEIKEYILAKSFGCEVSFEDEYPAWAPEKNELSLKLQEITNAKLSVIHAGLECAILKSKFPKVKMASYGPKIENPHSIRERVDLDSVKRVVQNVESLINQI